MRLPHPASDSRLEPNLMSAELMPIIAFLSGAMAAAVISCLSASRAAKEQLEILKRGHATDGPVRGCHVDRRVAGEPKASLPAIGSTVAVRYLPHSPRHAVIARLVSRFTD